MIRKHLYQIILLIILLSLLWMIYLPVRRNLIDQLEKLKTHMISGWEKDYELSIKYRSVSPTIINSLRIRDFSIENDNPQATDFFFEAERSSLYYGIRLFSRDKSRLTLRKVIIKRGTLYINIPEREETRETAIDPDEILEMISPILSRYFASGIVELRDMDVKFVYGSDLITWDVALLKVSHEEGQLSLYQKGQFRIDENISFQLQSRGSVSDDLKSINVSADVADFQSPYIGFDNIELQLSLNDGVLKVSKISDKFPLDISVERQKNLWKVNYQSVDFIPSRLLSLGSKWQEYSDWFDLAIDGEASCDIDWENKSFQYKSQLQIKGRNSLIDNLLGGYSRLTLFFEGSNWDVTGNNISLSSPLGTLSYKGDFNLPEKKMGGHCYLSHIRLPSDQTVDASFELSLDNEIFSILSDNLYLGDTDAGTIVISGESDWNSRTALGNVMYSGVLADNISLDFFADYREGITGKLWFDIDSLGVLEAVEIAGYQKLADNIAGAVGNSRIITKGFAEYSPGKENIRIDSFQMDDSIFDLSFTGYGNRDDIVISDIRFNMDDQSVIGTIKGKLDDTISLRTRFSFNGNYYDANAAWDREKGSVLFSGNHGLEGQLSFYDNRMTYLSLKTDNIPLSWKEMTLNVKLALSGFLSKDHRALNFHDNQLEIVKSPYVNSAVIDFSGNLDNEILHLNRLDWSDDFSEIKGNGKLILPFDGTEQFNGWITMLSDKNEKYKFLFFKEGSDYNGYGEIENFITERVPAIGIEGKITSKLDFSHIPGDPELGGNISAEFEDFGTLSCLLKADSEKVLLSGISGTYGNTGFESGILSLNRDRGDLTLSMGLHGTLANKTWHTGLFAEGISKDILNPAKTDFIGNMKLEEIIFDDNSISPPLSFHLERTGKDVSLYNEDRQVLNSYYNIEDGQIVVTTSKLLPFSFDLRGILREDKMDLTVSNLEMDLKKTNAFMPLDYSSQKAMVEFTQGYLKGDITMKGTPENPEFDGVLVIDPLQLNTAYSTKDKGVTRAAIDITGNYIRIPYFEMSVGNTGTIGAKGEVLLNKWTVEEFNFTANLNGRNGGAVPIIYPIKGLALNGEADGYVSFYGYGEQYFIDGELTTDRLVMSLAQSEERPMVPKNERVNPLDLKVDLNFITGRDVSMVLPNADFYFVKAILDIDQHLRFQLDNIPWLLSLTGELDVRSGEIAYFDKDFNLTEGRVTFNESEEYFDPGLAITAETTQQYQGEDVTLIINYEGSMFSDYDPQFSSIPSYSEREILSMLEPFQDDDSSSLATAIGSYADKYTFSAPFEEGLKDALNVDMVTIETGFLKNIIEDQLEGVYTNDSSQYNVARYLDGTVLNVGKYLGRDLFVAGGISVDYDESSDVMNGMGIDFNVKLEMETPFFNIGWNYLPDDLDSRNSSEGFISDSSITINFRL